MTGEPQTKPLYGICVGISGAVPEPEVRAKYRTSEFDVLDTIRRLAERVLADGGNIVYGSHPNFTDVIDGVAEGLFPDPRPERIRMYVARRYFHPQPQSTDQEEQYPVWTEDKYQAKHGKFARLIWVGGPDTPRAEALRELREEFVSEADALVCIGGKGPREGKTPGVEDEVDLAVMKSKPIYLIARTGGHTRTIRENWESEGILQARLNSNGLTYEENNNLAAPVLPSEPIPIGEKAKPLAKPSQFTTADVIDLILKGLSGIQKK